MFNKFGPLDSNYAVIGFRNRIDMLLSDLMSSSFNSGEPILFFNLNNAT